MRLIKHDNNALKRSLIHKFEKEKETSLARYFCSS
jgi:hypothetical protein